MYLSKFLLRIAGWKVIGNFPTEKKFIAVEAPHTSMWDFVIGRLFFYSYGIKPRFLIKKEMFFFPIGWFLKRLGGIPVDRSKKGATTEKMIQEFSKAEKLVLAITPEGTRQKVDDWKRGFYYIAKSAGVPVVPGYIDYKTKIIGIGTEFYVSDDVEKDIQRIKDFVRDASPKHPIRY